MKVAIYVRVSTEQQEMDNQLNVLRAWAVEHNHQVVREFAYVAHGHQNQAALKEVLDAAKLREFETLVIWSIDRLSRKGVHEVINTITTLDAYDVKVFSYQQAHLNPEMPFYSVIIAIFAELAKIERQMIVERTNAGLARARAEGKHMGRPAGAKDKAPRRRSGQVRRRELERLKKPVDNKSGQKVKLLSSRVVR